VTYFCMHEDFEKFSHGTPLIEGNNALSGGPLFLTPMMVDANEHYHLYIC